MISKIDKETSIDLVESTISLEVKVQSIYKEALRKSIGVEKQSVTIDEILFIIEKGQYSIDRQGDVKKTSCSQRSYLLPLTKPYLNPRASTH